MIKNPSAAGFATPSLVFRTLAVNLAKGIARRTIKANKLYKEVQSALHHLTQHLLNPDCAGQAGLTDDQRAALRKLAAAPKPPPDPGGAGRVAAGLPKPSAAGFATPSLTLRTLAVDPLPAVALQQFVGVVTPPFAFCAWQRPSVKARNPADGITNPVRGYGIYGLWPYRIDNMQTREIFTKESIIPA